MSSRALVVIPLLAVGLGGGYVAYRALGKSPEKVPVPSAAPLERGSVGRAPAGSAAGAAVEVAPVDAAGSVTPDVARTASAGVRACVDMQGEAIVDSCPSGRCGENGPFLSGFGLGSLHPDGCANGQGVRLVPSSVQVTADSPCKGRDPSTLHLDVDGGDLVVRDASGAVACKGAQLVGISFAVTGPAKSIDPDAGADSPADLTKRIHIGAIGTEDGWQPDATPAQTYTFIDDAGKGMCRGAADWKVDWTAEPGTRPSRSATPAAVLITGELYEGALARVYANKVPDAARWFTVGCAGGALSKMRLLGMDPRAQPAEVDRRQATLKMITAHYCPDQEFAFTTPGTPLVWSQTGDLSAIDGAARRKVGPIEARWTARGAACVSHGRVWQPKARPLTVAQEDVVSSEADLLARIGACGVPTCDQPTTGSDQVYWTTYTVNHQKH